MLLALSRDFAGIARFPRILKRHGIHVSVFCDPTFHVQSSRFVDQRHSCPTAPAAAAEALRAHLADPRHVYDMVIPGDDPLLAALARRAGEPWVESLLPIDLDVASPACVYSKHAFIELCHAAGLAVPRFEIGTTHDGARQAAATLGFPIFFKEETGYSGSGVRRFETDRAFEAFLNARQPERRWLVQEEIKGRIATLDALFDRGVPRVWIGSYVERASGPFGSSTVRRFDTLPAVEPILEKVGRATGAHGLLGLDFIHEQPSGRLLLLEVNWRPTAGHAVAERAGVRFGRALIALLRNEAPGRTAWAPQGPTRVPMFPEDFNRAIDDREWSALMKWLILPTYWRFIPWSDPRLMLRYAHDTAARFGRWLTGPGRRNRSRESPVP